MLFSDELDILMIYTLFVQIFQAKKSACAIFCNSEISFTWLQFRLESCLAMWVFFLLVSSLLLIDPSTGSQAFGKIHPGLSDRHAMELHFDINRDGKISLEEEELGHQHPAEFDLISKIPKKQIVSM